MNTASGLPLAEAASKLGLRKEALRKRVLRGSIDAYKNETGQWFVVLPEADPTGIPDGDSVAAPTGVPTGTSTQDVSIVKILSDELMFLRAQLSIKDELIISQARQAEAMQRDHSREVEQLHVLLQTAQRLIPSAVSDAPNSGERKTDDESSMHQAKSAPESLQPDTEPPEKKQQVSWWRRFFLGET